ncbi:hypothetical protein EYF80_044486 [Liparis tanakae]|uniref:Uncharacterized protein n=1 Tax=Liparis tanakae TaxID=230148 RepID=A0A4Z2FWK2_9TELE|nr:hypothetical protein EYF80_044486 [Liparis tanakae]
MRKVNIAEVDETSDRTDGTGFTFSSMSMLDAQGVSTPTDPRSAPPQAKGTRISSGARAQGDEECDEQSQTEAGERRFSTTDSTVMLPSGRPPFSREAHVT